MFRRLIHKFPKSWHNMTLQKRSFWTQKKKDEKLVKCSICLETVKNSIQLECHHSFCKNCIKTFIKLSIDDDKIPNCPNCMVTTTKHPSLERGTLSNSETSITQRDVKKLLGNDNYNRYLKLSVQLYLQTVQTSQCTNCQFSWETDENCQKEQCPQCNTRWCNLCQVLFWHEEECSNVDVTFDNIIVESALFTRCQFCKCPIEKISGCNSIFCTCCQKYFCFSTSKTQLKSLKWYENSHKTYNLAYNIWLNK